MQEWTDIQFHTYGSLTITHNNTSLLLIASIKGGNANVLNQLRRYFKKKRQFLLLKTAELR